MLNPLFGFAAAMLALTQLPTQIHIKIFPHLSNYEPMGKDADPTQVTLKSDSACRIYLGSATTASSTGTLKSSLPSLNMTLTIKSLATPLWFQCDGEISVVRKGAQANYSYSGAIYARPVKTGPQLIEVKSIDEYLKGVVPTEMPHEWPAEALKAQAVAARTYATFHIIHGGGAIYDVDDTVLYQAYTGNSDRTSATDRAVEETASTVMLYDGKIIQAYFSADAGGYTEDASHVWPTPAPYCAAKPEIYPDAPVEHAVWGPWEVSLSLQEINHKLEATNMVPTSNPVAELTVEDQNRFPSGRVNVVTATLLDGSSILLDARLFHRALGLKSTLFSLETNGSELHITGRGFGHGVGMGQYGARVLAQVGGWNSDRILSFYYTKIQFCQPASGSDGMTCRTSRD